MASQTPKSLLPAGNLALAKAIGITTPAVLLRRITYTGSSREREYNRIDNGVQRTEVHLPKSYTPAPEEGILGHAAFSLKHETPHLGLLSAAFEKLSPQEVGSYIAHAPTGAYARRIGFLYEFLTGRDLTPHIKGVEIGGNYIDLVDSAKIVTGEPIRNSRWRVFDNLPGSKEYVPIIERTQEVDATLNHDWNQEVVSAISSQDKSEEILQRALGYLYQKETKSSFEIERESPSEARAARFVEALKQAGQGSHSDALGESNLTELQNLIVDPRYAEKGFRKNQNYVGAIARWQNVVHYIPPPPDQIPDLMRGLQASVDRLGTQPPLAQATVASFGLVFHHPFNDGNGRLHRYLLHDSMARNKMMPSGIALPVSAAILADMPGYDHALEAFSKGVGSVAEYQMNHQGEMSIQNGPAVAWIWKYPDLTPQFEYTGKKLKTAVAMVAEEISYLVKYDSLAKQAKAVVDMPDRKLEDLLVHIHSNNGHLSNNKRKQRFSELTDQEIKSVESAYMEVFGASSQIITDPQPAQTRKQRPGSPA